ncbi:unnamed protein product, partial [Heterosigma akashiwo]
MDSGATNFYLRDVHLARNVDCGNKAAVTVGDGTKVYTDGTGELRCALPPDMKTISLTNVHLSEGLSHNVLSCSKLADGGIDSLFTKTGVQLLKDGAVVAQGIRRGDLYYMDVQVTTQPSGVSAGDRALFAFQHSAGNMKFLWHLRFNHMNYESLRILASKDLVRGMESFENSQAIFFCEPCALAKAKRAPFGQTPTGNTLCLMDRISVDLVGPFSVRSLRVLRYMCIALEQYSNYAWGWPLPNKSLAAARIKALLQMLHTELGTYPKHLRMDQGGEFTGTDFTAYLEECGIRPDSGPASTPQYNMRHERAQLHIETLANASLLASPLTEGYWDFAWLSTIFTRNRSPGTKEVGFKTPYETLRGVKPNVARLRPFGCLGYCALPTSLRKKMQPKAIKAWLVGYHEERKSYHLVTTAARKLIVCRDVTFAEGPYAERCLSRISDEVMDLDDEESGADHTHMPGLVNVDGDSDDEDGHDEDELITDENDLADQSPARNTRSQAASRALPEVHIAAATNLGPPNRGSDGAGSSGGEFDVPGHALFTAESGPPLKKALRDADWQKAMEAEWSSFEELEVCDVVPKSEASGGQVLRAVWVLTRKTTAEGEIIHKARLCADGSRAWPHGESYAPVIDKESLRTVVGLAWQSGMHLENFDVKTAYLYGTLDEPRYMVVPPGILPHVDRASSVLKLKKSVYGLPEAGRVW